MVIGREATRAASWRARICARHHMTADEGMRMSVTVSSRPSRIARDVDNVGANRARGNMARSVASTRPGHRRVSVEDIASWQQVTASRAVP